MTNTDAEPLINAISGTISSVISMGTIYPLDNLLTKMQLQTDGGKSCKMISDTIKKEGVKGFYGGLESSLIGTSVTWAIFYYVYEKLKAKKLKGDPTKNISIPLNLYFGILAGIVSTIISNPLWVATARLKLKKKKKLQESQRAITENKIVEHTPRGSHSCIPFIETKNELIELYNSEGIQSWLSGLLPSLMLVANPAIQFCIYDQLKRLVLQKKNSISVRDSFFIGALAKLLATVITYPIQVIKTHQQVTKSASICDLNEINESAESSVLKRVSTSIQHLNSIVKSEYNHGKELVKELYEKKGLRAFYAGVNTKLAVTVLNSAIMFMVFEKILSMVYKIRYNN